MAWSGEVITYTLLTKAILSAEGETETGEDVPEYGEQRGKREMISWELIVRTKEEGKGNKERTYRYPLPNVGVVLIVECSNFGGREQLLQKQ